MNLSFTPLRRTLASLSMLIGSVALACVALGSHAQQTAAPTPDKTYTIQRQFKAGDVDYYKMKMTQKINGAISGGQDLEIKLNLVMKETTKAVGDNGQVTVVDEYTKAAASIGGQDQDLLPMMPKLTIKKDQAGQIDVTAEGEQDLVVQQISTLAKTMMQSQAAVIPKNAVKVGDSWTAVIPGPTADANTATKIRIKLDGVEMLGSVSTLRLKTSTDTSGGPQSDTQMHGEATMYLDVASGKLVKMTTKADGTAKGAKISTELNLEKGEPEDAKPVKKDGAPK